MRISDWSSDVCSSDLLVRGLGVARGDRLEHAAVIGDGIAAERHVALLEDRRPRHRRADAASERDEEGIARCLEQGGVKVLIGGAAFGRSEEHTSELQSLMRISYAVFCLNKKNEKNKTV